MKAAYDTVRKWMFGWLLLLPLNKKQQYAAPCITNTLQQYLALENVQHAPQAMWTSVCSVSLENQLETLHKSLLVLWLIQECSWDLWFTAAVPTSPCKYSSHCGGRHWQPKLRSALNQCEFPCIVFLCPITPTVTHGYLMCFTCVHLSLPGLHLEWGSDT